MYINVIIFPLWLVINRPEVPWFTALDSHQPPGSCREIWPGSTVKTESEAGHLGHKATKTGRGSPNEIWVS